MYLLACFVTTACPECEIESNRNMQILPTAGYVQDWRISMLVLTFILIFGAMLFFVGAYVRCTDYRPEEERMSLQKGHRLTATNAGNVGPLVSDMETATLIHNHGDLADALNV